MRGLHRIKTDAIDKAVELVGATSFADLGGVWAINGGYTFYARSRPGVTSATLVDDLIDTLPDELKQRAQQENVRLIKGNFGRPEIAEQVGRVDAVILFDVLLHQVAPNWDELLTMYAERTPTFVIVHPEMTGAETVRLIDLGREEYLRRVPDEPQARALFDRLDEPHRGRTWRDAHDVWQWGLTGRDLRAKMDELGYRAVHYHNAGPWLGNPYFDNAAYVFTRARR